MAKAKKLRFFHTDDLDVPIEAMREVYPLGKKTYEYKREKKEVFYRQKKKGDYVFSNFSIDDLVVDDFDFFNEINNGILSRCVTRYIITQKRCNNIWSTVHTGKFTMNDGKFDLDQCTVEIKQNLVDEYSCIKENKNNEFNILTVGPIIPTISPANNRFEFLDCRTFADPCGPVTLCYAGPNPSKWSVFYEECTDIIPGTGGESVINNGARDYQNININDTHIAYIRRRPGVSEKVVYLHEILSGTDTQLSPLNEGAPFGGGHGLTMSKDTDGFVAWFFPINALSEVKLYDITLATVTTIYSVASANKIGDIGFANRRIYFTDTTAITGGLFMYDADTTVTKTVTNLTSTSNYSIIDNYLVYYESVSNELRLYHYNTATEISIKTSSGFDNVKIKGDYVTFWDSGTNTMESFKISSSSLVIMLTDLGVSVGGSSMLDTLVSWGNSNGNIYLYDLVSNTFTNTGESNATVSNDTDISMSYENIAYTAFNAFTEIKYYDITLTSLNMAETGTAVFTLNNLLISSNNTIVYNKSQAGLNTDVLRQYVISTSVFSADITTFETVKLVISNVNIVGFTNNSGLSSSPNDRVGYIIAAEPNITKIRIWYREIRSTLCIGGVPSAPSGGGWVVEEDNCTVDGIAKWVRTPAAIAPIIEILDCVCDMVSCVTPPAPSGGLYLEIAPCDVDDPRVFYWLLPEDITYSRNRLLNDVVDGLVESICPSINGVVSDFFQWDPDNVSLINYVTGVTSEVNHLLIAQKSDIRSPNATEGATIGNLKWSELVEWFRVMFEVYWFIDSDSVLRFEHISNITELPGLDLTSPFFNEYQENFRRFNYAKEEMKRAEVFKMAEQENIDFEGFPIQYKDSNGNFSLCVTEDEETNNLDNLSVDLTLAQDNPGALDRSGFFMTANTFDGVTYRVIFGLGAITGDPQINSPLSWANLHRDYKMYNRILPEGNLNNVFVQFLTVQRFKKQTKFKIPLCCDVVFDPVNLITTDLGNGEVETAEIDHEDDTLELKLKY